MATQDTSQLKERIISIIKANGPSLPVHIAKGIGQSMLFTSAFLSELLSEKRLKTSNMRVGSSPLYLIKGQEEGIENFSNHLKSREKDAFFLLKEKNFLKDSDQEPAIRVALRVIKDFAIPFKRHDEIYWRYLKVSEDDLKEDKGDIEKIENDLKEDKKEIENTEEKLEEVAPKEVSSNNQNEIIEDKKELNIFDKLEKSEEVKKIIIKKKIAKKKAPQKVNEKFFNAIKEYLAQRQIEILDIVGFSKVDLILKINGGGEDKLLVAYNKKSVKEEDIIKAHKKAKELDLKYLVLSFGEPLKKLSTFIKAVQELEKIEKIEKR